MNIKKLKLRPAGMFSNVNEVIQQIYLAEAKGYQFIIDWSRSCYREESRTTDPWLYYFKPCFSIDTTKNTDHPLLPGGIKVACTRDNIITPRLRDGDCNPLLLPADRSIANKIICRYISVNSAVAKAIDDFKSQYFGRFVVGLHIRGQGRTHGGVPELRRSFQLENGIPFQQYFNSIENIIRQKPEALIFTCSDSSDVIDRVKAEYGEKVITYDATRSRFGEMHANHKQNNKAVFPRYKLGFDVVVEAYLLSKTQYFVHGNSNVVNFVLCKNASLPHDYVYKS